MSILTLTANAKSYLQQQLANNTSAIGVFVALEKAGCAGYMYKIRLVDAAVENAVLEQVSGISFFIAKTSIPRISGSELDYQRIGLECRAVFANPNVTAACGCGDSVELIRPEDNG